MKCSLSLSHEVKAEAKIDHHFYSTATSYSTAIFYSMNERMNVHEQVSPESFGHFRHVSLCPRMCPSSEF